MDTSAEREAATDSVAKAANADALSRIGVRLTAYAATHFVDRQFYDLSDLSSIWRFFRTTRGNNIEVLYYRTDLDTFRGFAFGLKGDIVVGDTRQGLHPYRYFFVDAEAHEPNGPDTFQTLLGTREKVLRLQDFIAAMRAIEGEVVDSSYLLDAAHAVLAYSGDPNQLDLRALARLFYFTVEPAYFAFLAHPVQAAATDVLPLTIGYAEGQLVTLYPELRSYVYADPHLLRSLVLGGALVANAAPDPRLAFVVGDHFRHVLSLPSAWARLLGAWCN